MDVSEETVEESRCLLDLNLNTRARKDRRKKRGRGTHGDIQITGRIFVASKDYTIRALLCLA